MDRDDELGWETDLELNDYYPSPAEIREALAEAEAASARHVREAAVEPSLVEFEVPWLRISSELVEGFRKTLDAANDERPLQRFLERNPGPLVIPLRGGHGRWVLPQTRLGGQYVPDFMVAEKSSIGFEWVAVELESPRARLFTKRGDPAVALNHAIRQVSDWRAWLKSNRAYAVAPRNDSGLGLVDVDSDVPAWILIGRRFDQDPADNSRRREMSQRLNIAIHSYEWLLELAEARASEQ
jgi:hypothetical protein